MVRITLVIFALLSMFLLNACGGSNLNRPANIDDQDAVLFKTGIVSGKATRAVEKEYNDKDQLVEKEVTPVFEEVAVEANFDTKSVIVKANVINEQNKVETVTYEGGFNDDGVSILRPKNSKILTAASVRCGDACDSLIVDIGIIHKVDGKEKKEVEQFRLVNGNTIPSNNEVTKEVDPSTSNLTDATDTIAPVKTEDKKKEADKKNPTTDKKNNPVAQVEVEAEIPEPGTDNGRNPIYMNESIIRGEDSIGSGPALYPYNLGDKYPGKALGFYDKGSLVKGLDVMSNLINPKIFGFISVDRNDRIYYGSGLLVKVIQESSKIYSRMFPGHKFEVNDLSKQVGGRLTRRKDGVRHASHQNGLDVDILIPKKANKFDYQKIWALIKTLDQSSFVDVIFVNQRRIKELCSYIKSTKETNYQSSFGKLYRESGHLTHLHVRAKCTLHNPSCRSATYTKSKYGVCK